MGARVCGIAYGPDKAEAMISAFAPDYVLVDVRLSPSRGGRDAWLSIAKEFPVPRLVLLVESTERRELEKSVVQQPWRIVCKPVNQRSLEEAFGLGNSIAN